MGNKLSYSYVVSSLILNFRISILANKCLIYFNCFVFFAVSIIKVTPSVTSK